MTNARVNRQGACFARNTAAIRVSRSALALIRYVPAMFLAKSIEIVRAETMNASCFVESDKFVGNAQTAFDIKPWIERGICIKQDYDNPKCYETLLGVLGNINQLRAAEYNGSSGVLALLPTIGALLGAPTNEIWRLLTIVPFRGALAMALSFGGAILPIKVEDYERVGNAELSSVSSFRIQKKRKLFEEVQTREEEQGQLKDNIEGLTHVLLRNLRAKLHQRQSVNMPKFDLWLGLFGMVMLLAGAQAAMIVVERGAIPPWWYESTSQFWMHLWYLLVTATAMSENWVQLPFSKQFKLYLSDIPYKVSVTGGEDITRTFKQAGALESDGIMEEETRSAAIGLALTQLKTVQAGVVHISSGVIPTSPRNSILVMVSVIYNGTEKKSSSLWRLLSKISSIGVFVTGTAFFSSVQLLALPMAVMALTLLISAAVFSRAIASYITIVADRSQPMVHVMVNSLSEAHQVIAKIMTLTEQDSQMEENQSRAIQIEVNGHIFVNCRRVATRSRLWTSILGIMSEPFDLAKSLRPVREFSSTGDSSSLLPTISSTTFHPAEGSEGTFEAVRL